MKKDNIFTTILLILIIALGGYIGYDKFISKDTNNSNKSEQSQTNTNYENTTKEETNTYKSLSIDNSNCLNDCSNTEYNLGFSIAGDGIDISMVYKNNKKINVNIDRKLLESIYLYKFYSDETMYTFEFNKNIQDVFVGHIGQDTSAPMLFVLFEDGTVQYIDLYSKITTGKTIQKELTNVKNIIKFYSASNVKGGYLTVLAQTLDGNFYDLEKIINN